MSLRLRLLIGLVGVVAAGLLTAELVTYFSVQSFLLERVDEQLAGARQPAQNRLVREALDANTPLGQPQVISTPPLTEPPAGLRITSSIPPGTYAELRDASGAATRSVVFSFGGTHPRPDLPATLDIAREDGTVFTTGSVGSSERYRVRVDLLPDGGGVVVAIPLSEFDSTMSELRWVGIGVAGGVLVVVAVLVWLIVRLGLRPLDRIAESADGIAAGDLSRRLPVPNSRTEIGRLATALNRMLANIEAAFAERRASEERLRRFLADASHELRTPLTSIRGYAELFSRGAQQRPEDLATVLRRVDEQSARMSLLVDDLLLLARLDQGRPLEQEPVALAAVAADVLEDAHVLQPARPISLDADGRVLVLGDEARLRQVVSNLVNNALRHTPADAALTAVVRPDGDRVLLALADDGPGIAEADRAHIFEPFYRADHGRSRDQGGTGLGLAIVAAIVRAHGGEVSVRSGDRGHGTVFEVRLPLFAPAAPEPHPTRRVLAPAPSVAQRAAGNPGQT